LSEGLPHPLKGIGQHHLHSRFMTIAPDITNSANCTHGVAQITDKIKQDKKNIELYHHYEHNNINVVRL